MRHNVVDISSKHSYLGSQRAHSPSQSTKVMPVPIRRDDSKLIAVGATLLSLNGELGLFQYNKLVYLFEYFYIKNFGKRFTKEVFMKLPHGPVIVEYKKHISYLINKGIAKGDLSILAEKREVDDTIYPKFRIT